MHTVEKHILPNKISLLLVPLANTEAVTAIAVMGVGSRYESDAQQGLAHFTEHMVFKGGKKYLNTQDIAEALDGVGGEFNAFTAQEYTAFYTKTAAEHLELGLDVISDMLLHARFPADELEKEKGVIIEEINMYEDMPMRKVDQVLSDLVFGDTPIGRPIIGTKKSTSSFTQEDFLNYRQRFYVGAQCTIVLAGAVDSKQSKQLVEKYFAEMPAGEPYLPEPAQIIQTDSRVRIEEKKSEQTHLMLSVEAFSLEHPKRYIQRLLTTILGGNMSSRLFVSVREKQGLCYYVRCGHDTYTDAGLLVASAGVDNTRLPQAVSAILAEFKAVREEGVTEQELERAKQYLLGKLTLSLEDSEQVAEYHAMQDRLEKNPDTLEQMKEAIKRVTTVEVQDLAKELFKDEHLRLALIGPHQDVEMLDTILTLV